MTIESNTIVDIKKIGMDILNRPLTEEEIKQVDDEMSNFFDTFMEECEGDEILAQKCLNKNLYTLVEQSINDLQISPEIDEAEAEFEYGE